MSSSLAWAAPIAKIAIAPTQVVSRKLRIGILPATVPRVTDAKAHAVPRVGTQDGNSFRQRVTAQRGVRHVRFVLTSRLGLRGYVRIPIELTSLKLEAARSLFLRLIDRNYI